MKTPEEKYASDPDYHALVDVIEHWIYEAKFTPSEIREAAIYACIRYEQRSVRPVFIDKAMWERKQK